MNPEELLGNREIKFRAWDRFDKKMYTPCFRDDHTVNEGLALTKCLMEFTGFKDVNGKEIWTGDIVRIGGKYVAPVHIKYGSVEFGRYVLCPNLKEYPIQKDLEVIGNIFENPNLLENV